MKRVFPILLLLALLGADTASAQRAGAFARIGFGARGIGMGGGLVADVFSRTSPYYNPALAPLGGRQHVDAAAGFLSLDRELQHVQFAFTLPPRAGAAIGVIRAGVSDIDGRDASGYPTGELSVEETAVFTAFGVRLSDAVSGGFGLRFYRADLFDGVDAPVTIGLSLGLAARVSERLAFGLAVDDLLAAYRYDTAEAFGAGGSQTTDRFPVRFRFGAAYELGGGRGLITAEVEGQSQSADRRFFVTRESAGVPQRSTVEERLTLGLTQVRLGAEYWVAGPLGVRAGVDRLGEGAAPTAGIAVRQEIGEVAGRLDYTAVLEPYGLGVMHLVALHLDL